MPITITLDGDSDTVSRLATQLKSAGLMPQLEEPTTQINAQASLCPLCRSSVIWNGEGRTHRSVAGEICDLCHEAACRLDGQFRLAALKHYQDFVGQLRRMIRDVRSGADEPVFYRGING